MRSINIMKNTSVLFLARCVTLLLGLFIRSIFIQHISVDYLGLEGLFSNIFMLFNFAEFGTASVITYKLYAPLSKGDYGTISELMSIYRWMYRITALLVAVMGIAISFFIDGIITESSFAAEYVRLIFLVQLSGTVSSYLLAYKRTLFYADQKEYLPSLVDSILSVVFAVLRILVIIYLQSFLWYLVVNIIRNIISNIVVAMLYRRYYPQIRLVPVGKMLLDKYNIIRECLVDFFHKFSDTIFNSTDNIIISTFIGISHVGLLSNYTLITTSLDTFLAIFKTGFRSSFANFILGKDDPDACIDITKKMIFLNYMIITLCGTCFLCLIQPFISFWLGADYILSFGIPFCLTVLLVMDMLFAPIYSLYVLWGIFKTESWKVIFSAVLNIILSILLSFRMGIAGVLLGTVLSKILFFISKFYYITRVKPMYAWRSVAAGLCFYTGLGLGLILSIYWVVQQLPTLLHPLQNLLLIGIVGAGLSLAVNTLLFHKSEAFQYCLHYVTHTAKRILSKFHRA